MYLGVSFKDLNTRTAINRSGTIFNSHQINYLGIRQGCFFRENKLNFIKKRTEFTG